mmetsp:Transcript_5878/g.19193  ORF Transcript_5878/g.19193 Transcript_5878/m.19193 type:complete len:322 (-) Transcript_5878:17-982(-)
MFMDSRTVDGENADLGTREARGTPTSRLLDRSTSVNECMASNDCGTSATKLLHTFRSCSDKQLRARSSGRKARRLTDTSRTCKPCTSGANPVMSAIRLSDMVNVVTDGMRARARSGTRVSPVPSRCKCSNLDWSLLDPWAKRASNRSSSSRDSKPALCASPSRASAGAAVSNSSGTDWSRLKDRSHSLSCGSRSCPNLTRDSWLNDTKSTRRALVASRSAASSAPPTPRSSSSRWLSVRLSSWMLARLTRRLIVGTHAEVSWLSLSTSSARFVSVASESGRQVSALDDAANLCSVPARGDRSISSVRQLADTSSDVSTGHM